MLPTNTHTSTHSFCSFRKKCNPILYLLLHIYRSPVITTIPQLRGIQQTQIQQQPQTPQPQKFVIVQAQQQIQQQQQHQQQTPQLASNSSSNGANSSSSMTIGSVVIGGNGGVGSVGAGGSMAPTTSSASSLFSTVGNTVVIGSSNSLLNRSERVSTLHPLYPICSLLLVSLAIVTRVT